MPKKNKRRCFVLMPFNDELKEVYWQAIRPASLKAGFISLRVDELKGTFNINRKIVEHIFSSDVIVADLTGWNANVFYEIGVAHAIDNKTIMSIRKNDSLPFDVSNYRCIQYEQTEAGLIKLREDIVESLLSIGEWRKHPSNPVQDFKPRDAFIPKKVLDEMRKELQEKEERLRTSVPKPDWEALQKTLWEKEELLVKSQADMKTMQQSLAEKDTEISTLQLEMDNFRSVLATKGSSPQSQQISPKIQLRSRPLDSLSVGYVQKLLKEKEFFDSVYNKAGEGLHHQYEAIKQDSKKLVIDRTTGLIWQQSGSDETMNYEMAKAYVDRLNKENFAGYNDWRLPTLEEAMSLMEPEKKNADLYIDQKFDCVQRWIWTTDKESAAVAWVVDFYRGGCGPLYVADDYVRAVRRGQSVIPNVHL